MSALTVVIHAFQTMKTVQLIGTAALTLALAAPLAFQQHAIAGTRARIATLQHSGGAAASLVPRAAPTNSPALITGPADAVFDLKRLGEDALDGGYDATRRIREIVVRMDANNLAGLIQTVMYGGLLPAPRDELLKRLLAELRTRDLALFLEWSMKVLATTVPAGAVRSDYAFTLRHEAEAGFREWMAAHPADAASWAEANGEAWKQFGGGSLNTLTVAGLLKADPPRAYAMLERMSWQQAMGVLESTKSAVTAEQTTALAQWARSLLDVEKRRRIVRKSLWFTRAPVSKGTSYLQGIGPTLRGLALNADDLTWIAARLALDSLGNIESDRDKVPTAEIAWLENIVPASHAAYAKGALGHAFQPKAALIYLNAKLDQAPDDDLIAGYVESEDMKVHRDVMLTPSGGRHGDTAFRLATRVQEPERRVALLVRAWTDLRKDSAEAAQAILAIPELNADDRVAIEAQVAPLLGKKP